MNIMWITCANIEGAREGSDSDSIADEAAMGCEKNASERNERLRVWWTKKLANKNITFISRIWAISLVSNSFDNDPERNFKTTPKFHGAECRVARARHKFSFMFKHSAFLPSSRYHNLFLSYSFGTSPAKKNFHSGDKNIINSLI